MARLAQAETIVVGTSGWVYRHWANGVFYPAGLPGSRWFAHYASVFDTVEINNTLYRLPSEAAFDRWREQAPPGFVYAVKANRYLTHIRRLGDCAEPLERFLERARRLGSTLGPILYQLPPRWKANPERLEEFATLLDGMDQALGLQHVFEFRDLPREQGMGSVAPCTSISTTTQKAMQWPMRWSCGRCSAAPEVPRKGCLCHQAFHHSSLNSSPSKRCLNRPVTMTAPLNGACSHYQVGDGM